jgi:4-hydroxythreonine-4-phosphate dehydrogenase
VEKPWKPVVGVSIGDPLGIGPEIVLKCFLDKEVSDTCRMLAIGDGKTVERTSKSLGLAVKIRRISEITEAEYRPEALDTLDLANFNFEGLSVGTVEPSAGRAAVEYVEEAARLAIQGRIDSTTSAPVNKEAMRLAGFRYPGQTEIFAEMTKTKDFCMTLISGSVRIIPVTTHVPLRKALDLVKKDRILRYIDFAQRALLELGLDRGTIGVSGLNPHAGERGLLGNEEIEEIAPAVEEAKMRGIAVEGPVAADVMLLRMKEHKFDIALVMYHDHGNILIRALGTDAAVTLIVGLPIVRTSVVHGTAFDIAGKGLANHASLREAIKTSARIAVVRKQRRSS